MREQWREHDTTVHYAIEPPRKHAPALLGSDSAARMLNEPDAADRIVAEVDRREVLAAPSPCMR